MSRASIRYVDKTYLYGQQVPVSAPVSNPVIYGRFPKQNNVKSPVQKINKFFSTILLGLVMLSLVSYYFVSDSEKTMNNLGREIVALSNENIELQNKIDNMNSFNKVDAIIKDNAFLDTAKKVIEIPAVNISSNPKLPALPVNYRWSIGY